MEIPGYKVEEPLGKGGMATVYLAIQESLGRLVVLKVLNAVLADDKDYFERFLNEGRMIASLSHPHIVTIHDIGVADNILYISMEYVDGGDLKERLDGPLPPAEALDITCKIGQCLAYAHENGIVHRDVKPANILFRKDGTPLLTDFGIAKNVDMDLELTSTGTIMGSPHYMSPEQAEGSGIDGRGDIYSLGIIFYEMLTGRKAYHAESAIKIIMQHLQEPVPTLPKEYKLLQPLLNKMLAKRRDDRYATAFDMVKAIEKLQSAISVKAVRRVGGGEALQQEQVDIETMIAEKPYVSTSPSMTISHKKSWVEKLLLQKKAIVVIGLLLLCNIVLMAYEMLVPDSGKQGPIVPRLSQGAPQISMPGPVAQPLINPVAVPAPEAEVMANPPGVANVGVAVPVRAAVPAAVPVIAAKPDQEIVRALHWLARNSLEEFRLVQPVNDNAWFYYRRIQTLDPGNVGARQGIEEIIKRVTWMVQKQTSQGNYEQARAYVLMGLRVQPDNQELLSLNTRLFAAKQTFWQKLKRLFSSG